VTLFSFVLQQQEPWTGNQLVEPGDLAIALKTQSKPAPIVICVGPGSVVKNSLETGPANEKVNLKKLESTVDTLSREANIIIYCGCCPFNKCPNIRPAFTLLTTMGFKNHKLLNLPHNAKSDWIDKGYPLSE